MTESGPLDRFRVVLHEPQNLVNIALVIRAMKNMGLHRLRLVKPSEFDPYRIDGIAHDTEDVVASAERFDSLRDAVADAKLVVGTSARRRSSKQQWHPLPQATERLVDRALEGEDPIALVFGPEKRGLSNLELDLCDSIIHIPTNPDHSSLNLAHAALLVFYELRKSASERGRVTEGTLAHKARDRVRPATTGELEAFFDTWQAAMDTIGLFYGIDPLPKMRSFRQIFQRADLDVRELGLLEASAYEIIHYDRRLRRRLAEEDEKTSTASPSPSGSAPRSSDDGS